MSSIYTTEEIVAEFNSAHAYFRDASRAAEATAFAVGLTVAEINDIMEDHDGV